MTSPSETAVTSRHPSPGKELGAERCENIVTDDATPDFTGDPDETVEAKSPGLKHRHYSPKARVIIADKHSLLALGDLDAYIGMSRREANRWQIRICETIDDYAA